ncbi:MAG: hypothetical protein J1E35_07240 [Lachnospiraceae bacterium]|nr:hypothetical protein [Lachnospiraceae bacterium]
MGNPFSIETFLHILENDDLFTVDETSFYFDDSPNEDDHMLGCIREYDKPYWVGYCDIPNGCEFYTAYEMLNAKIFDGKSIIDRWEHLVFVSIGGIRLDEWLNCFNDKF